VTIEIETIAVDRLTAHPRNARTHPAGQISKIAESIRKYGFTSPVLVDEDNVLLAGHARTEAARQVGLSEIPAVRVSHLSDAEKRELMIVDNKLSMLSEWDAAMLSEELLSFGEVSLAGSLFSPAEMARLSDDALLGEISGQSRTQAEIGRTPTSRPTRADESNDVVPDDAVTFTCSLPSSEREDVFRAVSRAKDINGVSTTGEALLLIARSYMERHQ
jgi:hypothetical protein